ncbi:UNVERIFIED_CONTAM: hypothetical protein Slati_3460400 [Sesamum latifolium]|uniref:Endonuclease/exonuclease/phosphatase domain-containing protein n=1 Tax=Sesamum latifolium TaxID=2727402 RepID=A0AAW2UHE3_9LAMI
MGDDPWLVMGDFNTVLDMSEVHGPSGDLSVAMEDFSACLRNTGLLHVPMQGETYTWHNCSDGARSLWKKLDRMLANEQWLSGWPNTVKGAQGTVPENRRNGSIKIKKRNKHKEN